MKHIAWKLMFWLNYIFLILYMSWQGREGQMGMEAVIPLLISTLMSIDITYISSCNIRENKVISLFCGLLALDSWYVLLSFEEGMIDNFIFIALSPITWYVSIRFIFLFLFQGSGYKFRKAANGILLLTCMGSLVGIGISSRVFASLYGVQLLVSGFCFLFIILYHRKRLIFVLKSEWKCIVFSVVVITAAFLVYYLVTIDVQNHIANFGIYLPVLLLFMSIHGIIRKEHSSYPLSTVFSRKQAVLIMGLSISVFGLIILLTGSGYQHFFIGVNTWSAFIYICNIILEISLKRGESKIIKEGKYHAALEQLRQEELLKTEFANFLHDDVLQDLLSVKNMMTKAHRPHIQDIIMETLDNLNTRIRQQMQDYHPVILKNLTAKENYQNLIEAISQSFPQKTVKVTFHCSDTLFLVEPYNLLIYRLLKELLTNIFKHSEGNRARIVLAQENGVIELCVSDDGTANADCLRAADKAKHKGLASVTEQVSNMEGSILISDNMPHGIIIQIKIPMKGDGSYQYFVS